MDLWKLKLNSGVGRSLILTPKTLAGQSVVVWGNQHGSRLVCSA